MANEKKISVAIVVFGLAQNFVAKANADGIANSYIRVVCKTDDGLVLRGIGNAGLQLQCGADLRYEIGYTQKEDKSIFVEYAFEV